MLQKKILILFIDNNLNNFYLDYLFENIKKKLINVLKNNFIINIICYTNYKEKYKYNFMNRNITHNELCVKLDELNVYYEIKKINSDIYNDIYNDIKYKEYNYIFYIPNNSYVYNNIDIKLINNYNIIVDKNSNSFIIPFKYINIIRLLFLKKYKEIENIKYTDICYYHNININFNITTNNIKINNFNNINNLLNTNFKISNIDDLYIKYNNININFNITTNNINNKEINNIKKIIGLENIKINNFNNINNLLNTNFKISNIDDLYIKYNIKENNNIAIAIIGQTRTFLKIEVYKSLEKYIINDFKKNNINYILFFYIENKQEYYWQKVDRQKYKYNISKKVIEDRIKKLTDKYILKFYNIEDIKKEIPIIISFSFNLQHYLLYKIYLYIIEYEIKNNMFFKYVIKQRPDFKYEKYISNLVNMNKLNTFFIGQWDLLYIFPRHILKSIEGIYYLSIYPRVEDIYNTIFINKHTSFLQGTNLIINNIMKINKHFYTYIYMWLNNIHFKRYQIGSIVRP
jgi:hypothetical protein